MKSANQSIKTNNTNRRVPSHVPVGVLLISAFYAFGAIVLLAFQFINPIQVNRIIAERHGLPATTGSWFPYLVAGFALIMAWAIFSLSHWGYMLAVVYLTYFGTVGLFLSKGQVTTIDFGNFIWSFLIIVYLIVIRKRFFQRGNLATSAPRPSNEEF
jgi:hypothetical protein